MAHSLAYNQASVEVYGCAAHDLVCVKPLSDQLPARFCLGVFCGNINRLCLFDKMYCLFRT